MCLIERELTKDSGDASHQECMRKEVKVFLMVPQHVPGSLFTGSFLGNYELMSLECKCASEFGLDTRQTSCRGTDRPALEAWKPYAVMIQIVATDCKQLWKTVLTCEAFHPCC